MFYEDSYMQAQDRRDKQIHDATIAANKRRRLLSVLTDARIYVAKRLADDGVTTDYHSISRDEWCGDHSVEYYLLQHIDEAMKEML